MARELKRFRVTPGSEIDKLLDEASAAPLLLEKGGELYRLDKEDSMEEGIWAGYEPEKVREALRETTGTWADIDTDALIDDIYRAREEGSRPDTRP